MGQFFEVFQGDPKSLKARLDAIKTAGGTAVVFGKTSASAVFIITYTAVGLIAPAQDQV
jgi:hypothetical protein